MGTLKGKPKNAGSQTAVGTVLAGARYLSERMPRAAALVVLLACGAALAQRTDLRTFSLEQGLPSARISAVCEGPDGFLWVATDEGAARSDGTHFRTIGRSEGLPSQHVTALHCAPDGRVWIGMRNGAVAVWERGAVRPWGPMPATGAVRGFATDATGTTWAALAGGLVRLARGGGEAMPLPTGTARINALVRMPDGALVAGTDSGLVVRRDGRWVSADAEAGLPDRRITALFADSLGLVVGTPVGYHLLDTRLQRLDPSASPTRGAPLPLHDPRVLCVLRTRHGDLWLGTPAGIAHVSTRNGVPILRTITERNGLGHDLVRCLLEDRSGTVWAGTAFGGLSQFTSDAFLHFTEQDGLRSQIVSAIHRSGTNELWLGSVGGGLARWDEQGLRLFAEPEGLADPFVLCLTDGPGDALVVGTATQGLFQRTGERFTRLVAGPPGRVNALLHDDEGRLWAGTDRGLWGDPGDGHLMHVDGPRPAVTGIASGGDTVWVSTGEGLFRLPTRRVPWRLEPVPGPPVAMSNVVRDSQGNLWIGTEENGLYRLHGTRWDSLGTAGGMGSATGLRSPTVELVLLDAYENVWVGTRRGIDLLQLDMLQEQVLEVDHYGTEEGFIGVETFRNACLLDRDSTLWFGTVRGATRYDPRRVREDPAEPRTHLTDLLLFFEHVDWRAWCDSLDDDGLPLGLHLPPDRNHLTFAFTGISLAYPEKVRYRYMLEGHDPDWSPITATDRVTYSNLPPGDYAFLVLARNASGIWNTEPVRFAFTIRPPLWRTWPFLAGCAAVLALLLWAVVKLRERRLLREQHRLERMVEERTRELAAEKHRSEELLLNILPEATANELKEKGEAQARSHAACTVLFSDFQGFTAISGESEPTGIVADLDRFFRAFDRITDTHGLEKIKTIGDAYMCAAGVPEASPTHALDAVLTALEMLDAVDRINAERLREGRAPWAIRIGLHSGPLIAGVVGEKKFAYDIWGDTVNLASRLEGLSEAGRINISAATFALVQRFVGVTPRGPLAVKGKGEVQMFFADRLQAAWSADVAGRMPNAELLAWRAGHLATSPA